jgi:ABC-type iron transport system FetAB permease component
MFLIGAGSGIGVVCAIYMIEKHLFDERHRLLLDKLLPAG